jgi:Protein of unknown function (DUF3048) N-terminal domain/Protein of unknown function (DUF3048) C-terminal domain
VHRNVTAGQGPGPRAIVRPAVLGLVVALAIGLGVIGGAVFVNATRPDTAARPTASASTEPSTEVTPGGPTQTPPGPTLQPSPEPTAILVPAPLTGLLVSPEAAMRHPIAVMIDDHADARPQAGFNAAAIVWQAPAEGGIPRYMLIFQDQVPGDVGPVRSSREYFIEWAAEWRAMYLHAGGSPQALQTLYTYGSGRYVWNADAFRWEERYLWRVHGDRFAPHNLFTDGAHLRELATKIGAADGPLKPVWTFGPDLAADYRPTGGQITVTYPYEAIRYRYDAATNTYRRYIRAPEGGPFKLQADANGGMVAPKNVVILRMAFGPLNDGHPDKHRLEASDVGHGKAWISTNGRTIEGTWRKASITAPTLLFGPDGKPVTLTAGQTFVEVMPFGYGVTIRDGHFVPMTISPTGFSAS